MSCEIIISSFNTSAIKRDAKVSRLRLGFLIIIELNFKAGANFGRPWARNVLGTYKEATQYALTMWEYLTPLIFYYNNIYRRKETFEEGCVHNRQQRLRLQTPRNNLMLLDQHVCTPEKEILGLYM